MNLDKGPSLSFIADREKQMRNKRKPVNQVDDIILWGASPNQDILSFIKENQCSLELRARLHLPYSGLMLKYENEPKNKQLSKLRYDQSTSMKEISSVSAAITQGNDDIQVLKESVSIQDPEVALSPSQKDKMSKSIVETNNDVPFIIYVGNSPSTIHVLNTSPSDNDMSLAPEQEKNSNSKMILILLFFLIICLIGIILGLFFLLKSQGLLA
jgi:hypothetical protein